MLAWYEKFRIFLNRDDATIRTLTKENILIHAVWLKNLKQATLSVILKEFFNDIKILPLSHSSWGSRATQGED